MTEAVRKAATEEEVFRLGALVLGLHNALHGRDFTDDGPDFESEMDRFKAMQKSWLEKAKAEAGRSTTKGEKKKRKPRKGEPGYVAKSDPVFPPVDDPVHPHERVEFRTVAKSIDEDKRLITAVVLRPDVVDLHGDIYDAATVEAACHDFNKNCRQTNLQHVAMTGDNMLAVVESAIAKHSGPLGDGELIAGDWFITMHVPNDDVWKAVKDGDFTGFSVGCVAEVEELEDAA